MNKPAFTLEKLSGMNQFCDLALYIKNLSYIYNILYVGSIPQVIVIFSQD